MTEGRKHADMATIALRERSLNMLEDGLRVALVDHHGFRDARDVMLDFAPFFDAAVRLGESPTALFDRAAAGLPDDVADLARTFGRRTDVTLGVFGWRLEDDSDGPVYRFSWGWPTSLRPAPSREPSTDR